MTEPIDQMGFEIPSQTSFKRSHRSRPGTTGGRASDVPGVEKDQYGRYMLSPPSDPTAEPIPWTSVTTIVGQASGTEGLRVWTERGITDGLAESADLRARLASTRFLEPGKARDRVRDDIREEAKTLSGLHDAREWGSACHREWEMWARMGTGEGGYPGPPPELAADVTAGITAVLEAGLEVVKVEQVVVIEHLQSAGRLDKLLRAPNGKLRVGDWKTGKDVLTDPSKRENFACQFSGYANATHLWNSIPHVAQNDGAYQVADELDIDREIAYLIHVHDGTARIYEVPIADAWRDFQARAITHRHSSSAGAPQFLAIGRPVRFVSHIEDLEPMPVTKPNDWSEHWSTRKIDSPEEVADVAKYSAMTQLGMVLTGQDVHGDGLGLRDYVPPADVAPGPGGPTMPADPPGGTDEGTSVHEFEAFDGASGMVCTAMVLRDGGGDACGHVADHPIHDTPKAVGTVNGIGEPLQPLAKDVGAKRGCGVCRRIGHKRGSAACLGDADPLATPVPVPDGVMACGPDGAVTHLSEDDAAAVSEFAEQLKAPFASLPASDDAWCDGTCTPVAGVIPDIGAMIEPQRDDNGNVTGKYICASCYRPATVAAVRAHLATVRTPDGYVKPGELAEQQAVTERVVQPATIPAPPAQLCAHRSGWSVREDGAAHCPDCGAPGAVPVPSKPLDWLGYFQDAQNTQVLGERVAEMQAAGEATPELLTAASERWATLVHEGA